MDKKIAYIQPASLGEKYGLKEGMLIDSLNGNEDFDIIDYMISSADDEIVMSLRDESGKKKKLCIQNDFSAPLGVSFDNVTIDKPHRCANKCMFCFMDQMPEGLRKSLYFRDDDYRLSFLDGNYITLTNVSDEDMKRIVDLKLSPLNISVHTTNSTLRAEMMRNKKSADIMKQLYALKQGNIEFNLQLVLCPGYNDGKELVSSLNDIITLLPNVKSLSCVPVGLTKYRDSLTYLRPFSKEEAKDVIYTVKSFAERVKAKYSDICFCASDEFFIIAEEKLESADYYGDYIQFENGVGMLRSFIDGVSDFIEMFDMKKAIKATLVSGAAGYSTIKREIQRINEAYGTELDVVCIKNDFFGTSVTASGLVCGQDIIKQLKGTDVKEKLFIPSNMLSDDDYTFLDDTTVKDIAEAFEGTQVYCVPSGGYEFCEYLKEF